MGQTYVGEIIMVGFNFAPAGYVFCQGQLLPISEFETLFNLIGTTFGGDGQSNFAVPNLASRIPVCQGQGNGLSTYLLGETGGVESVTLSQQQIPSHGHAVNTTGQPGTAAKPTNSTLLSDQANGNASSQSYFYAAAGGATTPMQVNSIGPGGGSQAHSNIQPVLCMNYCISLFGIYPSPT